MIRKLYPNGKRKAFNITYDDGILQDVRFVELLNKYNLKDFHEIEINENDKNLVPKDLKIMINKDIMAGFILHKNEKSAFVVETLSAKLEAAKVHFYETAKWFTE